MVCQRELDGIIDGGGYLCGCSSCNFSRVSWSFVVNSRMYLTFRSCTFDNCSTDWYMSRFLVPMSLSSMLVLKLDIQTIIYTWRMGSQFIVLFKS